MLAVAISSTMVMQALYALEAYGPGVGSYIEISAAIAEAANQDPLFPSREDGCARTAAVLVALAWVGSRFNTTLVGNGGKSFGMYQIAPPSADAIGRPISLNMLNSPRDASLVAVDLIRSSMFASRNRPWEERLAWLSSWLGRGEIDNIKLSLETMLVADQVFESHLSQGPSGRSFPRLGPPAPEPKRLLA